MAKSVKAIGLLGYFGGGNSGNDGSLEVLVNLLKDSGKTTTLTCICSDPEAIGKKYRINSIRLHPKNAQSGWIHYADSALLGLPHRLFNWIYAFAHARKLDVLFVPGTGILDDFQEGPMGWPYLLFQWCFVAWICGADIAFVSIGAGPIEHPLSKLLLKGAAALASYRSYRDAFSKEYMASIGFDSRNDPVYPDIAFALPTPKVHRNGLANDGALIVGVGVMAYFGWRRNDDRADTIYREYLTKIAAFVTWLLDRGHRVRLLTGDRGDEQAIDDLLSQLNAERGPANGRLVAEPTSSLRELMEQIAETDVVVATRFHNVVCALKLSRPIVSISYAKKNDVLLADMGLGEFCQNIETLDVELLKAQFTRLVEERDSHRQAIEQRKEAYRRQLEEQFATLETMLR